MLGMALLVGACASRAADTGIVSADSVLGAASHGQPFQGGLALASPDGRIRVVCGLANVRGEADCFAYSVWLGDKLLIDVSQLGLVFGESGPFQQNLRIRESGRREQDQTWDVPIGKSSRARDHFRELTVALEEQAAPHRRIDVVFRAYDDGIAFRYIFPEQPGLSDFTITAERSHFKMAGDPRAYVLPLNSFTTPHEDLYVKAGIDEITPEALAGLPLLLEHPGGPWLAITEADLTDYAGMYLAGTMGHPDTLVSSLSPWPGQSDVKVTARAPHVSPWRVVMIGDRPGDLIESNLVLNLGRPSAIADTSWIRPGKISFPWLNGYVGRDLDFEPGLNTATMKHYIDFCAANGIEYHSLDGREEEGAWYGGPLFPEGPVDITTARPGLDLPEVLRYAAEKGVRLRVWLHWEALMPQIDEALAAYEQMGIEGIMVDFMDRDDQEMVGIYHEILEKAARHHLTVTFHGAFKPTGIRRTWPNLLNYEAVFNLEHNKGFRFGCPPEHNLTVPFTRMLAGPLDYHQGILRTTTEAAYRPIWRGPEMMGTVCHQLAMFVVYENYLPMVGDYPQAYIEGGGIELLAEIPVTWDETRVIDGQVGDFIIIARRSGDTWYVGSMTDGSARTLEVPLEFLGDGQFVAETWSDDPAAIHQPAAMVRRRQHVQASQTLTLTLAPAGGNVMRLSPR
jgi:alpha-glucosidase